jgi:hypothetical protein
LTSSSQKIILSDFLTGVQKIYEPGQRNYPKPPLLCQFFHKNCYFSENFQHYGTGDLFDSENIRKKP